MYWLIFFYSQAIVCKFCNNSIKNFKHQYQTQILFKINLLSKKLISYKINTNEKTTKTCINQILLKKQSYFLIRAIIC